MNTHIVRVNEKIEKIASLYHLNIEEIIKMNKHIQDWDHLIPGTKIRLPNLNTHICIHHIIQEGITIHIIPIIIIENQIEKENQNRVAEKQLLFLLY